MENPENLNENMYEIDEDIAAAEEAAARINEGKRLARKQLVEMQAGLPHRAALLNNIQFACICEAALLDTTSAQEALRRDLEEARGVIAGLKSQLDFRGPQGVNTADKYQEDCLRTAARAKNLDLELAILGLGLTGEAGEVADHIKKHVGHKHHLDKEKVIKELGDTMWYISILAYHMGYELSDVMRINV
jgi:NTP pyrophosphatase (non-canonical NTP hydrolase)